MAAQRTCLFSYPTMRFILLNRYHSTIASTTNGSHIKQFLCIRSQAAADRPFIAFQPEFVSFATRDKLMRLNIGRKGEIVLNFSQ